MKTCKDCILFENCYDYIEHGVYYEHQAEKECEHFKDKSMVVHAHWKIKEFDNIYSSTGNVYRVTCSNCGERFAVSQEVSQYERYCRHCGAKMDEEQK